MIALLAEATNESSGSSPAGKILVVLNWQAVGWALAFTLAWDVLDLWIRYRHVKFTRTSAFLFYFLFHAGLSLLATISLEKTLGTPWLIGLIAAVANEMVLSNANITFGQAPILPLLDKFRELRGAMQEEIDGLKKSEAGELIEKLSTLGLPALETKVTALLLHAGKSPAQINQEMNDLKAACAGNQTMLALKLANDFIQLDPVGAKKAVL